MHHTRDPREGWAMTDMAMDVADGGRGPDHPRPKVLIVGWDGVRDDTARRLSPSTLSGLAEHGRWWSTTLPGIDVAPTVTAVGWATILTRSEEHTSELQSRGHLVCRLLLEKKKMQAS